MAKDPMASARGRLALLLCMAVSACLFTALAGTFLVLRIGADPAWVLPEPAMQLIIGSFGVVVLAIGSFMLETAKVSLRRRDGMGVRATMLNACAKGAAFILLTGFSWYLLIGSGFRPGASTFAALYYLVSGLHLIHVAGATALVGPLAVGKGQPEPEDLRNAALVYHYTTVLSIVLLGLFHLSGA